ncbi:uncharacterized protein LOC142541799 [Primulina tabacum]|uniref:uncharacterized protein LOC142541799 n=1 Tax=Primulina tabacum TaxID=48773 RepID=UPI003F59B492
MAKISVRYCLVVVAFTDAIFKGNPAAVCFLEEKRDEEWLQAVAYDFNVSETNAGSSAQDDDMWYVITDGPMKIMKANIAVALTDAAPHCIEKPHDEWSTEDKRKTNLDNVAKDIIYKTLVKNIFSKIKMCKSAKEILEKLIQLCEENEQTKENKQSVAMKKIDNIRMKANESMNEFDERMRSIINELNTLEKVYSKKEVALKVMRDLLKE